MKAWQTAAAILALAVAFGAAGQSRRTTRPGLKAREGVAVVSQAPQRCDTVALREGDISISGYDKPTRTTRESAFFTNNTRREVESVIVTLRYFDRRGRLLHTVRRTIRGVVPAGETRQLYWPTWDRQQSFHYIRSRRARSTVSTPYDVRCVADSAVVAR